MRSLVVFWTVAAVLPLSACATYSALPLPSQPNLAVSAATLTVPASEFATPGVQVTRIDLAKPLDAEAVAALAVLNNPKLTALRAQNGVAAAQSYAAGLLPWPELTLGRGKPDATGPGVVDPWQLALTEDAAALIQHHEIERAGQASRRRVNLSVIWDEWQVAQEARILFADLEEDQSELDAIRPLVVLYTAHVRDVRSDMHAASVSQASIEAALATYDSLLTRQSMLEIKRLKDMAALKNLLGLAQDASLSLNLNEHPRQVNQTDLKTALADLQHRRPDLMALAAAYDAADAQLRQAILAQFPLIGISITRQRDTEGVINTGFALTFNLPFLNGARGEVAVARAKRQSLHDIYQERLDSAVSQVDSLSKQAESLSRTVAHLHRSLNDFQDISVSELHSVPFNSLSAYLQQRYAIEQEYARLYNTLDRTTIALDTLLGMPMTQNTPSQPDHS